MSYRAYIAASKAAYITGIDAGISPQELRAHTGVLGEAFVADYLGVQLTSQNNQRGYDLVDKNGLRVSVKTITTSNGIEVNENTLYLVDRIVVVWLDTSKNELGLQIVYDKSTEDFVEDCSTPYRGSLKLSSAAMTFSQQTENPAIFDVGDVIQTHQDGDTTFRKHASGSFTAIVDGTPSPARKHLLKLRDKLGLPDKNTNTTRSLGAQIFKHLGK